MRKTAKRNLMRYYQRAINYAHAAVIAVHGHVAARTVPPTLKLAINCTYRAALKLYYTQHPFMH